MLDSANAKVVELEASVAELRGMASATAEQTSLDAQAMADELEAVRQQIARCENTAADEQARLTEQLAELQQQLETERAASAAEQLTALQVKMSAQTCQTRQNVLLLLSWQSANDEMIARLMGAEERQEVVQVERQQLQRCVHY